MDELVVRAWFDEYLGTLSAFGKGQSDDLRPVLDFYAVPLLVTTDDTASSHATQEEVLSFARQLIDGMRTTDFDSTTAIHSEVSALNATSAVYEGEFVRRRADGSEIGRLVVTYLIVDAPVGLRLAAMVVHTHPEDSA